MLETNVLLHWTAVEENAAWFRVSRHRHISIITFKDTELLLKRTKEDLLSKQAMSCPWSATFGRKMEVLAPSWLQHGTKWLDIWGNAFDVKSRDCIVARRSSWFTISTSEHTLLNPHYATPRMSPE
jgi:hypothetical protein